MNVRAYYDVMAIPGDDEGWHVTRDTHVLKWHADKIDAVLDAVERAVNEAEGGGSTSLRIKGRDGRIEQERTYSASRRSL